MPVSPALHLSESFIHYCTLQGAELDLGSLPKHKSRLEREKEAATASASSRPRPAAARSRPGTAGQATGGLGDGLVKHKSR